MGESEPSKMMLPSETCSGVLCITLREQTERPVTVTHGTNVVVGTERDKIVAEAVNALNGTESSRGIPERWDGKAAERITRILLDYLMGTSSSS